MPRCSRIIFLPDLRGNLTKRQSKVRILKCRIFVGYGPSNRFAEHVTFQRITRTNCWPQDGLLSSPYESFRIWRQLNPVLLQKKSYPAQPGEKSPAAWLHRATVFVRYALPSSCKLAKGPEICPRRLLVGIENLLSTS